MSLLGDFFKPRPSELQTQKPEKINTGQIPQEITTVDVEQAAALEQTATNISSSLTEVTNTEYAPSQVAAPGQQTLTGKIRPSGSGIPQLEIVDEEPEPDQPLSTSTPAAPKQSVFQRFIKTMAHIFEPIKRDVQDITTLESSLGGPANSYTVEDFSGLRAVFGREEGIVDKRGKGGHVRVKQPLTKAA